MKLSVPHVAGEQVTKREFAGAPLQYEFRQLTHKFRNVIIHRRYEPRLVVNMQCIYLSATSTGDGIPQNLPSIYPGSLGTQDFQILYRPIINKKDKGRISEQYTRGY